MPATAELKLKVGVEGVGEAKALLQDFINRARNSGAEVAKEEAKKRTAKAKADTKAASNSVVLTEKTQAAIQVVNAKAQAKIAVDAAKARDKDEKNVKKHANDLIKIKKRAAERETASIRRELRNIERARKKAAESEQKRANKAHLDRKKIIGNLKGLAAGYVSVSAAKALFSSAKEGAQLAGLQAAYKATGGSAETLEATLKSLSNSVSDRVAIQLSNAAKVFKFTQKEIEQFGRISVAAGTLLGRSTEDMFESIVLGTARSSRLILDNLGILVNAKEANERYAKSLGVQADALNDVQKKQAFVNEVLLQGNSLIAKAPIADLAVQLGTVDAQLNNIYDTVKLIAAEQVSDILATYTDSAYLDKGGSRKTQANRAGNRDLREGIALGKLYDTGKAASVKRLYEATLSLELSQAKLNRMEKQAKKSLIDRVMLTGEVGNLLRIQGRDTLHKAKDINKAIDDKNRKIKEGLALLKREAAEEERLFKLDEAEAKEAMAQEAHRAFARRKAREYAAKKAARMRKEERKQKAAAREKERLAEKARKEELQYLSDVAAWNKAIESLSISAAVSVAQVAQDQLNNLLNLGEGAKGALRSTRDAALGTLPYDQQNSFASKQSDKLKSDAQGSDLIDLGMAWYDDAEPEKIAAIGAAIEANIASPLDIAAEAAVRFGHGMADAAAAAIFEGKSVKKATNEILRNLARRATSLAIFESAAALASLAIPGGQAAAILHGKAAATYGGLALITAGGAALTGGVRAPTSGSSKSKSKDSVGGDAPAVRRDGRLQSGGNTYYLSYAPTGFRSTAEDRDVMLAMLNGTAGREGSATLDPAIFGV